MMPKKNKFVFLFLFLFLFLRALPSVAQTVVTGRVIDSESGKGVEFANVSVLQGGRGRIVAICPAKEDGSVSLTVQNNGRYKVEVTFVGFETFLTDISCEGKKIDLGEITLKKSIEQLSPSSVSARQVIRRESDRIVYNVSADPDASKLYISEFMRKIPGLKESPRRGKLEYKGELIGEILVDGQRNTVINNQRQYAMSFIKANYMKKIELILPDSPEYQNKTPILLISLKQALPYGAASEIRGGAGTLGECSASPDVVLNMPVVAVGMNYAYGYNNRPELTRVTERTVFDPDTGDALDTSETETVSSSRGFSHNVTVDASSTIKNNLVLNGTINTSLAKDYDVKRTARDSESTLSSNESTSPFSFNGGLSAVYRWARGNRVSLKYTTTDRSYSEVLDVSSRLTGNEVGNKQNNVSVILLLRDQSRQNKWAVHVNSGLMSRNYCNRSEYWDGTVSGMDYLQNVYYLNGMYSGHVWENKLSYSVSVNAEDIHNTGGYIDGGSSLDYNEFKLVPTAGLKAKLSRNNYLSAIFSYHSQRPRFSQLSIYSNSSDPYDVSVGNASLKGMHMYEYSLVDVIEHPSDRLDQVVLSMAYLVSPDAIESMRYVNEDNTSVTTYDNIRSRNDLVFAASSTFKLPGNCTLDIKPELTRRVCHISGDYSNSYWLFRLDQYFTASIKGFELSESFHLRPFSNSALSTSFDMDPELDISLSRYWSKAKFGASVELGDILNGRGFKETSTEYVNYIQSVRQQQYGRYLMATVYWRIGKFKNHTSVKHSSYDM